MLLSIGLLIVYLVLTAIILRLGEGPVWVKVLFALLAILFPVLSLLAKLSIVGSPESDFGSTVTVIAAILNPGVLLLVFKGARLLKPRSS